jgi:hypothetical protein
MSYVNLSFVSFCRAPIHRSIVRIEMTPPTLMVFPSCPNTTTAKTSVRDVTESRRFTRPPVGDEAPGSTTSERKLYHPT